MSTCWTINSASTARPAVVTRIIIRRPPRIRSIAGPISGVTTANGAMVNNNAKATRPLDSSGLIAKKIEPARAAAMAPSAAALIACRRAKRMNGVTTPPPEARAPEPNRANGRLSSVFTQAF